MCSSFPILGRKKAGDLFQISCLVCRWGRRVFIAIPENNAKNSAPQSVNYCVTDFRRTPVRLQICSLQFALCSTAFFALFSGLAIVIKKFREHFELVNHKISSHSKDAVNGCSKNIINITVPQIIYKSLFSAFNSGCCVKFFVIRLAMK